MEAQYQSNVNFGFDHDTEMDFTEGSRTKRGEREFSSCEKFSFFSSVDIFFLERKIECGFFLRTFSFSCERRKREEEFYRSNEPPPTLPSSCLDRARKVWSLKLGSALCVNFGLALGWVQSFFLSFQVQSVCEFNEYFICFGLFDRVREKSVTSHVLLAHVVGCSLSDFQICNICANVPMRQARLMF